MFIVYSQEDEQEKNKLLSHLGVLSRAGIQVWSDDQIGAGDNWEQEINRAIVQAQVAVLFITAHFLNSALIMDEVVPKLLERQRRGELIIFPVLARACHWKAVDWLMKMEVRPRNRNPIWREGTDPDETLSTIAQEIEAVVRGKSFSPELPLLPSQPRSTRGIIATIGKLRCSVVLFSFVIVGLLVLLVEISTLFYQLSQGGALPIPDIQPYIHITKLQDGDEVEPDADCKFLLEGTAQGDTVEVRVLTDVWYDQGTTKVQDGIWSLPIVLPGTGNYKIEAKSLDAAGRVVATDTVEVAHTTPCSQQ